MNPLTNIMTPAIRRAVYTIYAIIGLIFGAAQVGISTAEASTPLWFKVAFAVFGYIGVAVGATAASNVKEPDPQDETGGQ